MQEGLRRIGGGAARLAEGRARLDGKTLVVQLKAGRALAEARQAVDNRGVLAQLAEHYGPEAKLVAEPLPGTGSKREQQQALMREVAANPDMQRVLTRLKGQLQHVVKKRTEPGSEPG